MVDERRREPREPVEYLATLVTGKDARATASLPNCPTGACGLMRSDTASQTNLDCVRMGTQYKSVIKLSGASATMSAPY